MRGQLRLASTIRPMPRDRRDRSVLAAMVVASMLGLTLAIANYVM